MTIVTGHLRTWLALDLTHNSTIVHSHCLSVRRNTKWFMNRSTNFYLLEKYTCTLCSNDRHALLSIQTKIALVYIKSMTISVVKKWLTKKKFMRIVNLFLDNTNVLEKFNKTIEIHCDSFFFSKLKWSHQLSWVDGSWTDETAVKTGKYSEWSCTNNKQSCDYYNEFHREIYSFQFSVPNQILLVQRVNLNKLTDLRWMLTIFV